MNLQELINIALGALQTNKVRTFLTALGIVIGTASVILMLAIGTGAKASIEQSVSGLGANILTLVPASSQTGVVNSGAGSAQSITIDDYEFLKKELAGNTLSSGVSTEATTALQVSADYQNTNTQVYGVSTDFFTIRSHTLSAGAFFSELQYENTAKVAVLGSSIATELFPDQTAIGKNIRVGSTVFNVVGVLNSKGQSGFLNTDNFVYTPFTAFNKYLLGGSNLRTILISAASADNIGQLEALVNSLMLRQNGISAEEEPDFQINSSRAALETLETITNTFTILLAGIASISLFVGGIGIMNTMIITITERTREIGLRKAVGAKESAILYQFVIESIVLSVAASTIGIILGVLLAAGVNASGITQAIVGLDAILLSTGVSIFIGLVFGIFPARRAAKLNPIDALKFE